MNQLKFLLLLSLGFFAFSCDDDNDDTTINEPALTTEEATALVEAAVLSDSDGLLAETDDAVTLAVEYMEKSGGNPCGVSFDSTVSYNFEGNRITANYQTSWGWTVNCNDNSVPVTLDFSRSSSGTYESNSFSSDDQSQGSYLVENLLSGEDFTISGSTQREGSQMSKVRNQNSIESVFDFTVSQLLIGKDSRMIESGTATFTLNASSTGGRSANVQGSLDFLGDRSATLTFSGDTIEETTVTLTW